MKKILCLLTVLLAACSTTPTQTEVKKSTIYAQPRSSYSRPAYTSNTNGCNTCSTSYTVSTPVEVIYKDTTYTTVYEPKTYTSTKYSRKPYDACTKAELCD